MRGMRHGLVMRNTLVGMEMHLSWLVSLFVCDERMRGGKRKKERKKKKVPIPGVEPGPPG